MLELKGTDSMFSDVPLPCRIAVTRSLQNLWKTHETFVTKEHRTNSFWYGHHMSACDNTGNKRAVHLFDNNTNDAATLRLVTQVRTET